ncbi:MAG: response regulator [Chloroflexota bacterium]|jgi:DNA-binding response OmpR family regulator
MGPRVVVVEDEPEMLDIICFNLEQSGYNVIPARDGVEAFEALEVKTPDAMVLDLNLPNMSGFRLLKLIRRDPRWSRIPLIVATAFAFEEVEDIANEGIDCFMTKPFDPAELISRLEYALSKSNGAVA